MPKLLIIYPHWYPSNLAGVHRARLIGNFLNTLNWQVVVLSVTPEYYEEIPDPDIIKLFSPHFKEYRVEAFKLRKPRIIGDIGIRAFRQLYQKGIEIINNEKPDFLWIPIPSFYSALLGRLLNIKTGIPYGIDYIDPWVRDISKDGSVRARLSLRIAKFLEPIAVKNASLITGVAYEYYKPVLDRNFSNNKKYLVVNTDIKENREKKYQNENLKKKIIYHTAFPYGFDPHDHSIDLPQLKMPWDGRPGVIPIVYAGAFMPNSQYFLEILFKAFAILKIENKIPNGVHLYFLGTGMYPHKRITAYANENGISEFVTEIRDRFPFLHILNILTKANRLLIIGSTEKHYTASKTFQIILSKRPFMGIFHYESTAVNILNKTCTDKFLVKYSPLEEKQYFLQKTIENLDVFLKDKEDWKPNFTALEPYSAKQSAEQLIKGIECVLTLNKNKIHL